MDLPPVGQGAMKTCESCSKPFVEAQVGRKRRFCSDRCRKDSHRRPCPDCGTLMNGSDGTGPNAPTRCVRCASVVAGAERKVWDREALIAAIRSFAEEFGGPPAQPDWCPSFARALNDEARAVRAEQRDDWPSFETVRREFGTWSAGIAAAGFTPRPPGGGGGNAARRRRRVAA